MTAWSSTSEIQSPPVELCFNLPCEAASEASALSPNREVGIVDYSQPWATALRKRARILKPAISLWRRMTAARYEDAFEQAILHHISPGDCVWDIGANVGHYTRQFAQAVGNQGKVIAFEPSPRTVGTLIAATQDLPMVAVQAVGLADKAGEMSFYLDPTGSSTLDSLRATDGATETKVPIRRGDDFLHQSPPNIIKIDVEGFEKEVIDGMKQTLSATSLRAVFVEVHFRALEQRGMEQAPADIAAALRDAGFNVRWTDASHIAAVRK